METGKDNPKSGFVDCILSSVTASRSGSATPASGEKGSAKASSWTVRLGAPPELLGTQWKEMKEDS